MKTFLGFTTGLLTGVIAGIGFTAALLLEDKGIRDYIENTANELNQE